MLAQERREQIAKKVNNEKSVLVKDLCETYDVTSETIRKDLLQLEKEGRLTKTHGGAYKKDGVKSQVHLDIRESIIIKEKEAIGLACVNLINDGDKIFLDASTTALKIANHLDDKKNLSVITNSLKVADYLSNHTHIKLILAGGVFEPKSKSFLGRDSEKIISKYYVDKCFVSCRGLSIENGITDSNEEQGILRLLMINHSKTKYLIIDKTKCDVTSFVKIGEINIINQLIIDEMPSEDWKNYLHSQKINFIETLTTNTNMI